MLRFPSEELSCQCVIRYAVCTFNGEQERCSPYLTMLLHILHFAKLFYDDATKAYFYFIF